MLSVVSLQSETLDFMDFFWYQGTKSHKYVKPLSQNVTKQSQGWKGGLQYAS